MRYREEFTVFPRALKSGRVKYYYQTYDQNGNRANARSTGQTSESAARRWCMQRFREGTFVATKTSPTFEEYTKDWFLYGRCPHIDRENNRIEDERRHNSKANVKNQRGWLERFILPFFGQTRLSEITPRMIEEWLYNTLETTGHTHNSVNHYFSTLRIILGEAKRLGDIPENPAESVKRFVVKKRDRELLTDNEIARTATPSPDRLQANT